MIYFENTQDSQRIQIPRAANPTAVPVPSHEYRAGDNISIVGDVISVTGLTNYTAGTDIDIQDGVISATGLTPVGYSAGTNIDITEGVISVTGINTSEFVTSGDVKSQIEAYNYATEGDVTAATSGCQETLVSGENIKTINGESILGPGNITITGGSGSTIYTAGDNIEISDQNVIAVTGITSYPGYSAISGDVQTQIDDAVSGITGGTGATYSAGTNIDITNNTISVTGITSFPGFSAMTKTNVTNALGYTPVSVTKDGNSIWVGSRAEYASLADIRTDTLYFVYE